MKGIIGKIEDLPDRQTDVMEPNLDRTAGQPPNDAIIRRAVELVAQEYMLANKRLSGKKIFEERHGPTLPEEVFEPNNMIPYQSELDSDEVSSEDDEDEEDELQEGEISARDRKVEMARKAHYEKLSTKANIPLEEKEDNALVWEKLTKSFRSRMVSEVVHSLVKEERPKKKGKGRTRALVPKVDLKKQDKSAPKRERLYPFMVDQGWLDLHRAAGKAYELAPANPPGFDNFVPDESN
ncbi:hypothetical protein ACEPAI_3441 [Sanghuangporus weigelae]